MKLSPKQMAVLRDQGRRLYELELRAEARRAAVRTHQLYIQDLKRQIEVREKREKDVYYKAHDNPTNETATDVMIKYAAETEALRVELASAKQEQVQLQEKISALSVVTGPLRELINKCLARANLKWADAGLPMDEYESVKPDVVTAGPEA